MPQYEFRELAWDGEYFSMQIGDDSRVFRGSLFAVLSEAGAVGWQVATQITTTHNYHHFVMQRQIDNGQPLSPNEREVVARNMDKIERNTLELVQLSETQSIIAQGLQAKCNAQQDTLLALENLIAPNFFNLFPNQKFDPDHLVEMLKRVLLERKQQRDQLYDLAWDMHSRWMVSFSIRQREAGGIFDEGYLMMRPDDREANRKFSEYMHNITNPHLPPLGLSKTPAPTAPENAQQITVAELRQLNLEVGKHITMYALLGGDYVPVRMVKPIGTDQFSLYGDSNGKDFITQAKGTDPIWIVWS